MFIPYLFFDGTTEEAMRVYCEAFAGEDLGIMTFGDVPDMLPANLKTDPEARARVLHASFTHAGGRLMASDYLPGWDAKPQAGCAVTHFAASRTEAERIFTALSEDAVVEMPFGDVLWADGFGMLKDRFGTSWMIGGPEPIID
ncbi:MAG: VOC family protein [Maritimibacter sp.]|nr:VOC family protein [Maritimibacter sp.]